jgi:hypothetical protein
MTSSFFNKRQPAQLNVNAAITIPVPNINGPTKECPFFETASFGAISRD